MSCAHRDTATLPSISSTSFQTISFLCLAALIILDTSVVRSASSTIAQIGPIDDNAIKPYISYWRRIEILE